MSSQTRATNKSRFENGDTPQGSDFVDLIDSFVSLTDTTAQSLASDLQVVKLIATELSAATIGGVAVNGSPVFTSASAQFLLDVSFGAGITSSASSHFSENVSVSGSALFKGGASFAGATVVSGLATMAGAVVVSGSATFVGPVNISATTRFASRVYVQGTNIVLYQTATVEQNNTAANPLVITLGPNTDLIDVDAYTMITWATPAGATAASVEVGVSGSVSFFCVYPMSVTSALKRLGSMDPYLTGTHINRWRNFAAGSGDANGRMWAIASIQGSNTAISAGKTMLQVRYIQN